MSFSLPGFPKRRQIVVAGLMCDEIVAGIDLGAMYDAANALQEQDGGHLALLIDAELQRQDLPVSIASVKEVRTEADLVQKYFESYIEHHASLYYDQRIWNALFFTYRKLLATGTASTDLPPQAHQA